MLIDSHAHLTDPSLASDLQGVLSRAKEAKLEAIVNICTTPEQVATALSWEGGATKVFHAASTTPHDVDTMGEAHFDQMAEYARDGFLVAVGETGLDYYYTHSKKETQIHFLRRYLHVAKKCGLPIILHCREAFEDLFDILDQEYVEGGHHLPGVFHCFTGSAQEAEQAVLRGYMVSIAGIVTFKKSAALREAVKTIPLNNLLIETDSPYLAPQTRRGKTNEPAFVEETARVVAEVKGCSFEELAQATTANAKQIFRLPEHLN